MTEKKEVKEIKEEKVEAVQETVAKALITKKTKTKKTDVKIERKAKEVVYPIRGAILEGVVVSAKARRTVTVERLLIQYISKYERYKKVKSKVKAHVPEGINVKEGDKVKIGETRRISKTKNFVVIEVIEGKKWNQWV